MLYLWGLGASGWANAYYSAAAQAGAASWKALLFGATDAAGGITVDKTPASVWVMGLSARIFGVNSWSILVPQALMGVATVWLLYAAVKRVAGEWAGLLAGVVLALTPVAVLMFRFNNPDALLVLLLTAGAYATVRAIDDGRMRWLVLAGACVGFGFLTKMGQAFLVLPAFGLAYVVGREANARSSAWQRLSARWSSRAAGGCCWCPCGRRATGRTSAGRRTTRCSSSPSATTVSAGSPVTRPAVSAAAVAAGAGRAGAGCSAGRWPAASRGCCRRPWCC